jgi:hypothetical protein
MAPAFGQAFQVLTGLPPGYIAVSAHFDDGDPRLFAGAANGVWSLDLGAPSPQVAHEEIDYSAATGQTYARLATPTPSAGGPAIVAWAPEFAVVPDTRQASTTLDYPVLHCPVRGPCAFAGSFPVPPWWELQVRGNTLVVQSLGKWYLSRDLGSSSVALTPPPGTSMIGGVILVGAQAQLWLSVVRSDRSIDVVSAGPDGRWQSVVSQDDYVRSHKFAFTPVDGTHVIALLDNGDHRCRDVNAGPWLPHCSH